MKYMLKVDGDKATEVLTVNGKDYKRSWESDGRGGTTSDAGDFCDMLEADGFSDSVALDEIYGTLDTEFFVADVIKICMMNEGEVDE